MVHQSLSEGCYESFEQRTRCCQAEPPRANSEQIGIGHSDFAHEVRQPYESREDRVVGRVENRRGELMKIAVDSPQERYWSAIPGTVATTHGDAALNLLWNNFAVQIPGYGSCGLVDIIRERYTVWPVNSAAALATQTVAYEVYNMWRASPLTESVTRHVHGRALIAINAALTKDTTALQDDSLIAVLLLHFHANISNYKGLSSGSSNHQEGALALASYRDQHNFETRNSQRLLQAVRSYLVSSAIRTGEHIVFDATIWDSGMETHRSKSGELDLLGIEIAELKANYLKLNNSEAKSEATELSNTTATRNALFTRAVTVDHRLRTWEANLTPDWFPASVATPAFAVSPTTSTTQYTNQSTGIFDVYVSIEAADTMNRYRVYRLICLHFIWSYHLMQNHDGVWDDYNSREQFRHGTLSDSDVVGFQIQKLADQICNSVAFHLGDQGEAQITSATPDSVSCRPSAPQSTGKIPRVPISSGSWYILGPLSFLVHTFSAQVDGKIRLPPLREGQLDWMKARLLRIMQTHGVIGSLGQLDEGAVRRLREALRYTSGV